MYKGILVVGAYYDKIKNLMKKWCQKGPKIDAKIDILAIRGPTFEILGHVFFKTFSFFGRFLRALKNTKKRLKKNMLQNLKSRPPDRQNVDFGIAFGPLLASFLH